MTHLVLLMLSISHKHFTFVLMMTALYQAERGGKEQETQRLAGCARLQPGGHLREEREPCCRVEQASGGVQLSFHLHSLWHVTGGKVNACPLTFSSPSPPDLFFLSMSQ